MTKRLFITMVMSLLSYSSTSRTIKQFIPSMWYQKCIDKCPDKPLDMCDFYFQDYEESIPYFDIPTNSSMLSPPILDKFINRTVDTYNSTRPACSLNLKKQYKFTNKFYPMSINHIGHIFINKTTTTCDDFCGKCILLYIVKSRPHWSNGNYTLLLSGDGNTVFPEERRCVVFKTSPCY